MKPRHGWPSPRRAWARVALQRGQLEELIQSLSRSRDENLVVDRCRPAPGAAAGAADGSLQPLVAALKSASQRIERAAQPRLAPVLRAMGHDLEQLEHASVTDTAGLLVRIDDLVRQVDDLPLINQVAQAAVMRRQAESAPTPPQQPAAPASRRGKARCAAPGKACVTAPAAWCVSRVDHPEAMLIAPDQAFFLRENLKLCCSRTPGPAGAAHGLGARRCRHDHQCLEQMLRPRIAAHARRATALQQLRSHMKPPSCRSSIDSFAALATAAAGR